MSKLPHPGQLRHWITIGKSVSTVGENGYPTWQDEAVATVRASVDDASTAWAYREMADANTAQFDRIFCIRHCSDIEPGMYVEHEGKKHTIVQIEHYDYKHRWIQLRTRRQDARDDDPQDTQEEPEGEEADTSEDDSEDV